MGHIDDSELRGYILLNLFRVDIYTVGEVVHFMPFLFFRMRSYSMPLMLNNQECQSSCKTVILAPSWFRRSARSS